MAMPSRAKIIEYWKAENRLYTDIGILIDWGEPTCWACGESWNGRYDVNNIAATWSDCLKAWNQAPLQRCHIIPRSLGGFDEPSNLFLMCRECHDLSPDTTNANQFFKWVENQNWYQRGIEKLRRAFRDFDIEIEGDDATANQFFEILQTPEFQEWCKQNVGIHGHQLPPFGARLSRSTIVAALLSYQEKNLNSQI